MPRHTGDAQPDSGTRDGLMAVAFDWGHTVMDERRDADTPLPVRPVHLMPGVADVLPRIAVPLALWANTRVDGEAAVRQWLERAGLNRLFRWVVTSVDAGARKPAPEFFEYALSRSGLAPGNVLFVGNQLNTDIAGAAAHGIASVWLSGPEFRSDDDRPCAVSPTCTIATLHELPALLRRLR